MKTKKGYTRPELEIVTVEATALLAGSFIETLEDDNPITTSSEILAPEVPFDN